MNQIPATSGPQPDQAQFEEYANKYLDMPEDKTGLFEKTPGGAYINSYIFGRWLTWRAGWLACCAQHAPAPKPVTEAELLRAMDQFGCAPLVVNAQSVGFVNYFIANRDSSWHWRQDSEGAKSCN